LPKTGAVLPIPRSPVRRVPGGVPSAIRPGISQLALPSLTTLVADEPAFAHPFERHFARLLDGYGLRWSYEPTTFLLSRRPDGSREECFTPDFYLPDLRIYVELTAMRQPLVTRKHRKVRLFRMTFPAERVVVLYRRDYHRMLSAWSRLPAQIGQDEAPPDHDAQPRDARLLYSDRMVRDHLDLLAWQVGERFAASGEPPLLIGLGAGGRRMARDLADRLRRTHSSPTVESLVIADRNGSARVVRDGQTLLSGSAPILVSAMVSTGLTTEFAAGWLRRRGTSRIDVCALLDRASARVVPVPLGFGCLPAPVEHLVGYGLEHRWQYHQRPDVSILDVPYDGPLMAERL
jgi:hypoxanthine phosphoribosyltransferase